MEELGHDYMEKPRTSYGFEIAWNTLKQDKEKLTKYLMCIKPTELASLFKVVEPSIDVVVGMIDILSGIDEASAAEYLLLMPNMKNFSSIIYPCFTKAEKSSKHMIEVYPT